MRLRQAKKILKYYQIYRASTRRMAYRVAWQRLSEDLRMILWSGAKLRASLRAKKFQALIEIAPANADDESA